MNSPLNDKNIEEIIDGGHVLGSVLARWAVKTSRDILVTKSEDKSEISGLFVNKNGTAIVTWYTLPLNKQLTKQGGSFNKVYNDVDELLWHELLHVYNGDFLNHSFSKEHRTKRQVNFIRAELNRTLITRYLPTGSQYEVLKRENKRNILNYVQNFKIYDKSISFVNKLNKKLDFPSYVEKVLKRFNTSSMEELFKMTKPDPEE